MTSLLEWTEEDEAEFQRLSEKRVRTKRTDPSYDLSLGEGIGIGEAGERIVGESLKGEVKRCFAISRKGVSYGKIFVETENYGRPSGINSTKADWWYFLLDGSEYNGEIVVGIQTQRLRRLCQKYEDSLPTGENKASIGKRIPIVDLIKGNI